MNFKMLSNVLMLILLMLMTWYCVSAFCVYNVYAVLSDEKLNNITQNALVPIIGAFITLVIFVLAWRLARKS